MQVEISFGARVAAYLDKNGANTLTLMLVKGQG